MKIDEIPYVTEEVLGSEKEVLIHAIKLYAKMFNITEEEAKEYTNIIYGIKEPNVKTDIKFDEFADGFSYFTKCWFTYTKRGEKKLAICGYVCWAVKDDAKAEKEYDKLRG